MAKRIAKALSYRAISTIEVFAISFVTTGTIEAAGSIAGVSAIVSTLVYIGHEKLWHH